MGNACVFIYHEDGRCANILCMDAARDFTDEWITIDTGYNAYVVDVGINMVVCDACHLRGYVEGIGGRKIKCPIFLSPPDDALTGVGKTLDDAAVDALDNWVYNGTNDGAMMTDGDRGYLFAIFFMKEARVVNLKEFPNTSRYLKRIAGDDERLLGIL